MSSVLRSLEPERVAGQFEILDLFHADLQQPGEGVWLDRYVSTPRYGDAQGSLAILEGVALQYHAIALRNLEQRIRGRKILKGLLIGNQIPYSRYVDSL